MFPKSSAALPKGYRAKVWAPWLEPVGEAASAPDPASGPEAELGLGSEDSCHPRGCSRSHALGPSLFPGWQGDGAAFACSWWCGLSQGLCCLPAVAAAACGAAQPRGLRSARALCQEGATRDACSFLLGSCVPAGPLRPPERPVSLFRGSGSWQPPLVSRRFLQGPLCPCPASLPASARKSREAPTRAGSSPWPCGRTCTRSLPTSPCLPPGPPLAFRCPACAWRCPGVPLLPLGACVRCPRWARGLLLGVLPKCCSPRRRWLLGVGGTRVCVRVCVVGECTRGRGRWVWGAWICVWFPS